LCEKKRKKKKKKKKKMMMMMMMMKMMMMMIALCCFEEMVAIQCVLLVSPGGRNFGYWFEAYIYYLPLSLAIPLC
jgi:hypothetical protein